MRPFLMLIVLIAGVLGGATYARLGLMASCWGEGEMQLSQEIVGLNIWLVSM